MRSDTEKVINSDFKSVRDEDEENISNQKEKENH